MLATEEDLVTDEIRRGLEHTGFRELFRNRGRGLRFIARPLAKGHTFESASLHDGRDIFDAANVQIQRPVAAEGQLEERLERLWSGVAHPQPCQLKGG